VTALVPSGGVLFIAGGAAVLLACAVSLVLSLRRHLGALRYAREQALLADAVLRSVAEGICAVDGAGSVIALNPAAEEILGVREQSAHGRPVSALLPGLEGSRLADEPDGDEIVLRRADGREMRLAYRWTPVQRAGSRVAAVITMIDVTERQRHERLLRRRAGQQSALAALGDAALRGVPPGTLFDHAVALLAETLPCRLASVLELSTEAGLEHPEPTLLLRAGVGWRPGVVGRARSGADAATYAGYVLRSGGAVVSEDMRCESRFKVSQLLVDHGVAGSMACVIGGSERPFGVLTAHSTDAHRFGADDVRLLETVAHLLGTAIDRDQVARRLRRQHQRVSKLASERGRLVSETLEAEDRARRRLSELLHDESLQELFFVRQELAEASARGAADLDRALEGVDRAIAQLRGILSDLHPAALQQLGLEHALRSVAQRQAQLGHFEVSLDVQTADVGRHDQLVLSLARELLTNVAKHARASHATLEVSTSGQTLGLLVSDDGCGIAAGRRRRAVADGHIGLASAVQRVEGAGGTIKIVSQRGAGTAVRVSLPLTPAEAEPALLAGAGQSRGGAA
jgi:PAS domain S-box-containing protein